MGKGGDADYKYFLLIQKVFQKASTKYVPKSTELFSKELKALVKCLEIVEPPPVILR